MSQESTNNTLNLCKLAFVILVSCLVIRVISLGMYPLMDTTEARYGEMARIMAESGDWITPMFDYGVPFWGKPPMFTWLSGAGFELFGINEFAARLPHLLVGCLTLWFVWFFARRLFTADHTNPSLAHGKQLAWLSTAILASTAAFIIISGAVMTDAGLMFAVSLSMISFWLAWHTDQKRWGYLFFVGLALGMLSKGPLAIVLVGISLTLWLSLTSNWKSLISKLPWISGSLLFLVLSLPWYLMAEMKTPGFLDYFIVGEHVKRFLISGWEGDLYGTAHKRPRGTIWLLWLLASLPWFPVLFYQMAKLRKQASAGDPQRSLRIFLWVWLLAPLLLFTFSGNILWSYVLPGIPALALLITLNQRALQLPTKHYLIGLLMPVLLTGLVIAMAFGFELKTSEKALLNEWKQQPDAQQVPLYYLNKRPFSAQFYSDGQATLYQDEINALLASPETYYLAVNKHTPMNVELAARCQRKSSNRKHVLWYCAADQP